MYIKKHVLKQKKIKIFKLPNSIFYYTTPTRIQTPTVIKKKKVVKIIAQLFKFITPALIQANVFFHIDFNIF